MTTDTIDGIGVSNGGGASVTASSPAQSFFWEGFFNG